MRTSTKPDASGRPKIYTLLGQHAGIRADNGDRINELRFMRSLSQWADVHYNDRYTDFSRPDFNMGQPSIEPPKGRYDLHYVRGNPELFAQLAHPKIYLGLPYDARAFAEADAIIVTTQKWKDMMEVFPETEESVKFLGPYFPVEGFVRPKRIINIGQSIDPLFWGDWMDHEKTLDYRIKFGWGFTIGYFGRLYEDSLPYDLIEIAPSLLRDFDDLSIVFGGTRKTPLPETLVRYVGRVPYDEMRYAQTACDLVVCNHQEDAEWLGMGKVLDALAARTPILAPRQSARVEQLGEDYPLYFQTPGEMEAKIRAFRASADFRAECAEAIDRRRDLFTPEAVGARLRNQLGELAGLA